jgi:hypothetical protein
MKSAVCTLFEGNYHYGVGALANSLYAQGYRGTIFCGYRGALPPWAASAQNGQGAAEFRAADGLALRFVPLSTPFHLTNIKPDFALDLWRDHCPEAEALFYFDPDIVVLCPWAFYEEWVRDGVALCADVNPAMPPNHPIRGAWKRYYAPHGVEFRREPDIYFNGGFFGLHRGQMEFLECWKKLQEWMAPAIGGLQNVNVRDRTFLFHKTDQDAMNVAAMASEAPISPMGQDGMDIQHGGGGYVMSHALGGAKPWKKKFLKTLLTKGHGPSRADRMYFRHVQHPIRLYSGAGLSRKKAVLLAASALGRILSKN